MTHWYVALPMLGEGVCGLTSWGVEHADCGWARQPRGRSRQTVLRHGRLLASILAAHPTLELTIDPTDHTRLRFVLVLQGFEGAASAVERSERGKVGGG
jgi:hypothetical protein